MSDDIEQRYALVKFVVAAALVVFKGALPSIACDHAEQFAEETRRRGWAKALQD